MLSDGLGLTSYLQIQVMQGDTPFGLRHYWKSHFVDALPDDLIDRIVDHYLAHPQDGWDVVLFEQMHGAAVRNTAAPAPPAPIPDSKDGTERHTSSGAAPARLERLLAAVAATPSGLTAGGRSLGRAIGANRATAAKLTDSSTQCGLTVATGDRYLPGSRLLHWAAALDGMGAGASAHM